MYLQKDITTKQKQLSQPIKEGFSLTFFINYYFNQSKKGN